MSRNLKFQFLNSINDSRNNLKLGASKHSLKKEGKTGNYIFSYADRRNLVNTSANFCNFIKENYNIKMIKDLKQEHYQAFLDAKAKSCSTATMELYTSNLKKLIKITNKTYGLNKKFDLKIPVGQASSHRNVMMSEEHFSKLVNSVKKGSSTYNALILAKSFGCRVSELPKIRGRDIREMNGKLYLNIVDSKGKKSRLAVCVSSAPVSYLKELSKKENERLIPIRYGSINQNIRRAMKRNNLSAIYKNSTCHSIRKCYAQELFCEYRKSNTMKDSLNAVSKNLGHCDGRWDISRAYLAYVY